MISAVYPELQRRHQEKKLTERQIKNAVAAIADAYSFPTNLDSDPPVGGNAPRTAAQMLKEALEQNRSQADLEAELKAYAERKEA